MVDAIKYVYYIGFNTRTIFKWLYLLIKRLQLNVFGKKTLFIHCLTPIHRN